MVSTWTADGAVARVRRAAEAAYLGMVTPAFSQAWIRAEPANAPESATRPAAAAAARAVRTLNRDLFPVWPCVSLSCVGGTHDGSPPGLPTVNSTSAWRRGVVAKARGAAAARRPVRHAERARDCRSIVSPWPGARGWAMQRAAARSRIKAQLAEPGENWSPRVWLDGQLVRPTTINLHWR